MALEGLATQEKKQGRKIGAFRAPQENFTCDQFIYGKLLGLGSYSKVVRVKKKDTGQEYALKVMDKRHIMREKKVQYVKMERLILDQLDHPGVTRLHFTFQDNLYLYMGMESCNGGELFDQIKRKGRLPLEETRFYAAEVVDTLEYIHSEGLIHRDLKPENILFTSDGHVKIADFGSAKMLRSFTNGIITCDPDEKSCTFVGTAEYVAPEVLNSQPITPSVDMWALGCVIFQMLDGRPPFKAASEYLTFQKVLSRDFAIPQHFHTDAKDLIEKLLNLVPEKRPDFATIKKHTFFTGVSWSDLWNMPAPSLALPSGQTGDDWDVAQLQAGLEAFELSESSESGSVSNSQSSSPKADASGEFSRSPEKMSSSQLGGCTASHTLTEDCTLEQWQRFLNPGEQLLRTSAVRNFSGMVTKRQQLLLTNKPRLAIVDVKKASVKQEIPWSNNPNELYVEVEDNLRFSIRTPNVIWHFEDLRGLARGWRCAIEKLQNEHLCNLQDQLLKAGDPETKENPAELPPSAQTGESGHIQITFDAAESLSEKSPPEIQEPRGFSNQPAENRRSRLDLRPVNCQGLPLIAEEELGEPSLYSSHSAETKTVQSTDTDFVTAALVDEEPSSDAKNKCHAVLADKEELLVCNYNEFGDVSVNEKKLANSHSVSEPGSVGNENPVEAPEQVLAASG